MRQFQGAQGKARMREKRPKKQWFAGTWSKQDFKRVRGFPPGSSKVLLGHFSFILAFPWSPWNCLKLA